MEKPALGTRDYETIGVWREGLAKKWGGDPLAEEPAKLDRLMEFCEFAGKNPDELVDFCFLRRKATGERFGSVKRREELIAQLRAFRDARGLSGMAGRRLASDILSFFIHNGVLVNPGSI